MVNFVLLFPDAGDDDIACAPEYSLIAATPNLGTGVWSIVDSGAEATFANASTNSTLVTGLQAGANEFKWTISHLGCSTVDNIVISNNQFTVSIGADITTCDETVTLTAPDPDTGTGTWSSEMGATFSSTTTHITTVSNMNSGEDWIGWYVTKNGCGASDEITLTNNRPSTPTVMDSHPVCETFEYIVATTPSIGTGVWSTATSATILETTQNSTYVTDLEQGANTFRWMITNNDCSLYADVVITNDKLTASAQTSQTVCGTTATLTAELPTGASGIWENMSNGTITDDNQAVTTVTNLSTGVNSFLWYISNDNCSDEINVQVLNNSVTIPVGATTEVCGTTTNFPTISASDDVGTWSVVSGDATIEMPSKGFPYPANLEAGENPFVWTASNGGCTIYHTIINNQVTANAGGVQNICITQATFAATDPLLIGATGYWEQTNNNALITSYTSFKSTVNNLLVGENTFIWTVSKGICTAFSEVSIFNNSFTVEVVQIGEICESTSQLWGELPAGGSGVWTPSTSANVINSTLFNSTVEHLVSGVNEFTWRVTKDGCSATDIVTITNNQVFADAGNSPTEECSSLNTLTAANPNYGTGVWSVYGESISTIANETNSTTSVSGLGLGEQTFRWTVTQGICTAFDDVGVINNSVTANAGEDVSACGTSENVAAIIPDFGTGTWFKLGGTATIVNSALWNTEITGLTSAGQNLRWTVTEGNCTAHDDMVITNNQVFAELTQTERIDLCKDYTTLPAVAPVLGTGFWTESSETGIVVNHSQYNSQVTDLNVGSNLFEWTVTKNECSDSKFIEIWNNTFTIDAGDNREVCEPTVTLAGDNILGGNGTWTTSGTAKIVTDTQYDTQVTDLMVGTNKFIWTVVKDGCTASDFVFITNNTVTIETGESHIVCSSEVQLSANNPALTGSTGVWTSIGQTATITEPTLYNSEATELSVGENQFQWFVTKGICSKLSAVTISNNYFQVGVEYPEQICEPNTILWGELPEGGTGIWTVQNGGTIADITSSEASITDIPLGLNHFQWKVSKDGCTALDLASIFNNTVTSVAGDNRGVCGTQAQLAANNPSTFGATGVWTSVNQTATITNPTSYNSAVTDLSSGANQFQWKVTKGNCSKLSTVTITNNFFQVDIEMIGEVCESTSSLWGELPEGGTGVWTALHGGTIADNTSDNTTVTDIPNGINQFRWLVQNNGCSATNVVEIVNNKVVAEVGDNQNICSPNAVLVADNPALYQANGIWTSLGQTAIVTSPTQYNSAVTNLSVGANQFQWKVIKGKCTKMAEVVINNNTITAGVEQIGEICETNATLWGELPTGATGLWTVLNTGIITNITSNNTTVSDLQNGINRFEWKVERNGCTASNIITVINNKVVALAGDAQIVCSTNSILSGNNPVLYEANGIWTSLGQTAVVTNSTLYNSAVTNLSVGANQFQWKVTKGICSKVAEVIINNNTITTGVEQIGEICRSNSTIWGNLPAGGTGLWTALDSGDIADFTSENTTVTNLQSGINRFEWKVERDGCTASDIVEMINNEVTANAGSDAAICKSDVRLEAEPINGATGVWSINGNANILMPNSNVTPVFGLAIGENVFEWKVTKGICTASAFITINNQMVKAAIDLQKDGNTFIFSDISLGNVTSRSWNLDDGTLSDLRMISHTYTRGANYDVCISVINEAFGCIDNACITISTQAQPLEAIFTWNINDETRAVEFTNQSVGNVSRSYWTYGDGNYSDDLSPVYTYGTVGKYEVCLYIYDTDNGLYAHSCRDIKVGTEQDCNVEANFNYYIDNASLTVKLENQSSGDYTSSFWNLNNQFTSDNNDTEYQFDKPGFYIISLAVSNADVPNCIDYYADFIQIGEVECNADFEFEIDVTTREVQFYEHSNGNINNYFWSFGDGTHSTGTAPAHIYKKEGEYSTSLTISDESGLCAANIEKIIQVGYVECSAKFSAYVDKENNQVHFQNEEKGNATTYYWEFGDGSTSSVPNPVYKYESPGLYNVNLHIFSKITGCVDDYKEVITVGSKDIDCEADFIYTIEDKKVLFFDRSIGNIVIYTWNLGDNSAINSKQNPVYEYTDYDYYNVCLTVIDQSGISNITCKKIAVITDETAECNADFIYTVDNENDEVAFKDISTGDIDKWTWEFGDNQNSTSDIAEPLFSYNAPAFYLVKLTAENTTNGCINETQQVINIGQDQKSLRADFSFTNIGTQNKYGGYPVEMAGAAFGDPAKTVWTFGDGEADSTTTTPTHIYGEAGTYEVCFTVSDPLTGLEDTECQTIVIEATDIETALGEKISFATYPNPFSSETNITFTLPQNSEIEIAIFDLIGNRIETIFDGEGAKGNHHLKWNANNTASGVYFVKLQTEYGTLTHKLIVVD